MSKLMKDGKEWQAFFKIGKDDFERERKLPKRDSHSLASSLKHHSLATVTSGKSPKPQDQEDGVDSLSIMAPHPASMKRVKSDQIVYNQPGNSSVAQDTSGSPILQDQSSSPIQEISPPSEQVTPPIPLSPPIEESPSVRSRNSLEAELGLSPADADAINRLTKNLEDEDLAHLANAGPSVTSPPQSLSPPSPSMKSLPPNSPSIKGSAYNSVPASIAPSHLAESPAVVPPPSSADPPTESSPSNRSPVQRRRHKVTVADFDIMRVLGKGCAGKVLMVKYRRPGGNHPSQVYAMKSIKKNHVLSHRELQHTLTEQSVLRRVADEPESNPFIVRLWWSFHVSFFIQENVGTFCFCFWLMSLLPVYVGQGSFILSDGLSSRRRSSHAAGTMGTTWARPSAVLCGGDHGGRDVAASVGRDLSGPKAGEHPDRV
jgi:hypothetical protein